MFKKVIGRPQREYITFAKSELFKLLYRNRDVKKKSEHNKSNPTMLCLLEKRQNDFHRMSKKL